MSKFFEIAMFLITVFFGFSFIGILISLWFLECATILLKY